ERRGAVAQAQVADGAIQFWTIGAGAALPRLAPRPSVGARLIRGLRATTLILCPLACRHPIRMRKIVPGPPASSRDEKRRSADADERPPAVRPGDGPDARPAAPKAPARAGRGALEAEAAATEGEAEPLVAPQPLSADAEAPAG